MEEITPFPGCPALDGYHWQTNSLSKIFHHNSHPISEDMLPGLGSGITDLFDRISEASRYFHKIAEIEEDAFRELEYLQRKHAPS